MRRVRPVSRNEKRSVGRTDTKLSLDLGDAPADGRDRHFEAPDRFRKAPCFDYLGEHHERIEVRRHIVLLLLQAQRKRIIANLENRFPFSFPGAI